MPPETSPLLQEISHAYRLGYRRHSPDPRALSPVPIPQSNKPTDLEPTPMPRARKGVPSYSGYHRASPAPPVSTRTNRPGRYAPAQARHSSLKPALKDRERIGAYPIYIPGISEETDQRRETADRPLRIRYGQHRSLSPEKHARPKQYARIPSYLPVRPSEYFAKPRTDMPQTNRR